VNGATSGGTGDIKLITHVGVESRVGAHSTTDRAGRRFDDSFDEHRVGLFGHGKKEVDFVISDNNPVLNL